MFKSNLIGSILKGTEHFFIAEYFKEQNVVNIIHNTGNCVAASIPLALVTAYKNNKIKKNDLLYLIGTGAGLSIASCLIKV